MADILSTLEVRHSRRAKRLSLRANPKTARVELVVPPLTLPFSINKFVNKNEGWIRDRQKSFQPKSVIKSGCLFPLYGENKTIRIIPHTKRTTTIAEDGEIISIETARQDVIQNLKRWVIDRAKEKITPLAYEKARQINKTISKIDLRDTSSRWGSCSSDGRVMLSWRLIMAPDYVLDYVVGHEVAHLAYMNHSQDFWNLCYTLSDNPDEGRQWLKNHGNTLLSFF